MTWRVSNRYGIKPDSNAPGVPVDPGLRLERYMSGGTGSDVYCIGRPLNVEVPRAWWTAGTPPSPVQLAVEVSDMPSITGEDEDEFHGFPWNVCFYVACASFQSEAFFAELRANGCEPPWDPWFVVDAVHGGHSTPLFQLDADSEETATRAAQVVVPWVERNFKKLMRVPVNKMGSHGWDWLRGELVSRPGLANMTSGGGRSFA